MFSGCFKTPCSVFLENGDSRKIIGFYATPGQNILVRTWDLDNLIPGTMIPPSSDTEMSWENVVVDRRPFPKGYEPIGYTPPKMTIGSTSPVSDGLYKKQYEKILCSSEHYLRRKEWLWSTFFKCHAAAFQPVVDMNLNVHEQMVSIQRFFRRAWHIWEMWEIHMLNYPADIASELVFSKFDASVA